jgi:outer membrane protein
MRKVLNLGLMFALLMLGTTTVSAQQQVIAYANVDTIITNMPDFIAARTDIENFAKKKEEQLQLKKKQIEAYVDGVRANVENLSINQQKEEEAKIAKMQQDLQTAATEAQQEMATREQEKMNAIYTKFNNAVEAVAKEKGYTYILDMKAFLYLEGGINATADVKAKLGVK